MSSPKNSEVDGRIRGRQIDIEFNDGPSNKPQELKLRQVTPFAQILLTCLAVRHPIFGQYNYKLYQYSLKRRII